MGLAIVQGDPSRWMHLPKLHGAPATAGRLDEIRSFDLTSAFTVNPQRVDPFFTDGSDRHGGRAQRLRDAVLQRSWVSRVAHRHPRLLVDMITFASSVGATMLFRRSMHVPARARHGEGQNPSR